MGKKHDGGDSLTWAIDGFFLSLYDSPRCLRSHGVAHGATANPTASFWSPERRRWAVDTAENSAHGGVDSGASAASRKAYVGEEVEAETAKLFACFDP